MNVFKIIGLLFRIVGTVLGGSSRRKDDPYRPVGWTETRRPSELNEARNSGRLRGF